MSRVSLQSLSVGEGLILSPPALPLLRCMLYKNNCIVDGNNSPHRDPERRPQIPPRHRKQNHSRQRNSKSLDPDSLQERATEL